MKRFLISAFSVLAVFQFSPIVASAQTVVCPAGWVCTPITPVSASSATLSLDGSSPLSDTVPVTNTAQGQYLGLPVLVFDVNAQGDTLHLHNVLVSIFPSGNGTVNAAYLYQGSTPIASSAVVNNVATFRISDNAAGATIPINTTVPFTVKVDVSGLTTPGSQEVVTASMSNAAGYLAVYDSRDNAVTALTGSANGNAITVAGPGPAFSLAGTPTITTTNITPLGNATSSVILNRATFNVNVQAIGQNVTLGLPNSTSPAFGNSATPTNLAQVYRDGAPVISGPNLVAGYSQPSNTTLSSDGASFTIAQNQSVTIPVTYQFLSAGTNADVCAVQLTGIAWSTAAGKVTALSNSMANNTAWRTSSIGPCGNSNWITAPIATSTPVTNVPASASVANYPTLQLSYNSKRQESLLTGTFNVTVNGGSQGVNVYKNNAGGTFYNNADGSQGFANSQSVIYFGPVSSVPAVISDNYGQLMYVIPPGKSVTFKEVVTTNPQQLFAGTYYAGMSFIYVNPGTDISNGYYLNVPVVKSNLVTIVGELGPYISSVTTPVSVGQKMAVNGVRLNDSTAFGAPTVYIDGNKVSGVDGSKDGTVVFFVLPSLTAGSHQIYVTNANGKSNVVAFQVAGSATTAPSVTLNGSPTLVLSYNSARKESALTATFNGVLSAGNQTVELYQNNATVEFLEVTKGTNANSPYTVSLTATAKGGLNTTTDSYGNTVWVIPAGQSANIQVSVSANPLQMFAGTYFTRLDSLLMVGPAGTNIALNSILPKQNATNLVTIVGEVSPYITSVTTPISVGQKMTITGQRLLGSILIDNSLLSNVVIGAPTDGTSLYFTLPSSYANGVHTLQVNNQSTGASNVVTFQVQGTPTTGNKPPVISGGTYPTTLAAGQTGTWSISASDPQNGSLSYSINWGDATIVPAVKSQAAASVQTSTFTHAYANPGNYTIVFSVTNSAGLSAQSITTVTITGNPSNTTSSPTPVPAPTPVPVQSNPVQKSSANYSSGNYSMTGTQATTATASVFTGFINFLKSFF